MELEEVVKEKVVFFIPKTSGLQKSAALLGFKKIFAPDIEDTDIWPPLIVGNEFMVSLDSNS